MRRRWLAFGSVPLIVALGLLACSKSQPAAPSVVPTTTTVPPPADTVILGHLTGTVTGEPLGGEAVSLSTTSQGALQTTTDASGGFQFTFAPGTTGATVTGMWGGVWYDADCDRRASTREKSPRRHCLQPPSRHRRSGQRSREHVSRLQTRPDRRELTVDG